MDWKAWTGRWAALKNKATGRARARVGSGRPQELDGWSGRRFTRQWNDELRLYAEMRRTFPLLDVAVTRLVQLCGHPRIEGPAAVREALERWMSAVPTGPVQRGLGGWVEAQLDHMLVYGRAVGRIRLTATRRDVGAVLTVDPAETKLETASGETEVRVFWRPLGQFDWQELSPALTLLSLRAPQGALCGASLLRSLPFVAEACSIIENATAQVWQRMGCPSFHVSWNPQGTDDPGGSAGAAIAEELQQTFEQMMRARRQGEVKDWFTSGPITATLLGSPGQITAVEESFRVFAEQMVAATGLPPWLLGLHWSTTERLSVQQADFLVAGVEALRRELQPQLEYLLDLRQRLRGDPGRFRVTWPPINLRDAAEQARALAWREQATARRIENARKMWELGFWSQDRAAREADPTLTDIDRRLPAPPGASGRLPERLTPGGE